MQTNSLKPSAPGMRILLVMPPGQRLATFSPAWQIQSRDYGRFPPLGLMYLAACLRREGFGDVYVLDAGARRLGLDGIRKVVEDLRPALVGTTSFTVGFAETVLIAEAVKSVAPDIHVCVGGPHVGTFPGLTLERDTIDSIVVGEGEAAVCALAHSLVPGSRQRWVPPEGVFTRGNLPPGGRVPAQQIPDIEGLPYPARDLVSGTRYCSVVGIRPRCLSIITSRGCPFQCTFCDVPFKKVRTRPVEDVVQEIESVRPGRDTEIFFYDDTLNVSASRFADLCRAMAPVGLPWSFRGRPDRLDAELLALARRSGCYQVHLGVETTKDEHLAYLRKGVTLDQVRTTLRQARKAGIRTIVNLMIGLPFERSESDIMEMIQEVCRLDPYLVQINVFQPIPGTEIFEHGVEKGVVSWREWNAYVRDPLGPFVPRTWDEHIPQEAIGAIWQKAYRAFYFRPSKVLDLVLGIRSWWELREKLAGGLRLLRLRRNRA